MWVYKRFILFMMFWVCGSAASAQGPVVCTSESQLSQFEGLWVLDEFLTQLKQTRSFAESTGRVDFMVISMKIDPEGIFFSGGWHEGDFPDNNCVRMQNGQVWAKSGDPEIPWTGPYVRVGHSNTDEAAFYLSHLFRGCYRSNVGERWCLAPQYIHRNGLPIAAQFVMDASETEWVGNMFRLDTIYPPLWAFLPRKRGWAIYRDDWLSSERRGPGDPYKRKPWRVLTPEGKAP